MPSSKLDGGGNLIEIIVDEEKCTGCGTCLEVCPKGPRIWVMEDGKAKVLDADFCTLCTFCIDRCPVRAITIRR